jgi:hypothetical protein
MLAGAEDIDSQREAERSLNTFGKGTEVAPNASKEDD